MSHIHKVSGWHAFYLTSTLHSSWMKPGLLDSSLSPSRLASSLHTSQQARMCYLSHILDWVGEPLSNTKDSWTQVCLPVASSKIISFCQPPVSLLLPIVSFMLLVPSTCSDPQSLASPASCSEPQLLPRLLASYSPPNPPSPQSSRKQTKESWLHVKTIIDNK